METTIESKVCSLCNSELPLDNFYYLKSRDRYHNICKACYSEKRKPTSAKYRENHKEEIDSKHSAYTKANRHKRNEYYAENREKLKAINKASYEKNRDVNIQKRKEWYLNNKEKHAQDRAKYAAENKPQLQAARRKWENDRLKTDVNYRLHKTLSGRIRDAAKGLYKKSKRVEELIGCSVEEFKAYIESQFQEGMSWDNWAAYGWHIDHKVPLTWFDLSNENCRKLAFHYTNMQPLWWDENIKKGNKYHHKIIDIYVRNN